MSSAWSWYLILGTVATLAACFWLVAWTNRQRASDAEIEESESHVWDEDVREHNNPLPMWWLWLFIGTVVWGVAYLVYYPGMGDYPGIGNWSQSGQYDAEIQVAEAKYGEMFAAYGSMAVEELVEDPAALAIGASLYQNYCSQCHGSTARGARGFPDLTDSVWQYGGAPAQIEHSILHGRTGVMPPLGVVIGSDEDIDDLVDFVLSMPDGVDGTLPGYANYMKHCIACHGPTGDGMQVIGSPRLNDNVWLYGSSPSEIRKTIVKGRQGHMPANRDLIGTDRARILAAYVYSLSQ